MQVDGHILRYSMLHMVEGEYTLCVHVNDVSEANIQKLTLSSV